VFEQIAFSSPFWADACVEANIPDGNTVIVLPSSD
jgi:hypothetical protein